MSRDARIDDLPIVNEAREAYLATWLAGLAAFGAALLVEAGGGDDAMVAAAEDRVEADRRAADRAAASSGALDRARGAGWHAGYRTAQTAYFREHGRAPWAEIIAGVIRPFD